jgi:hypothetical protein
MRLPDITISSFLPDLANFTYLVIAKRVFHEITEPGILRPSTVQPHSFLVIERQAFQEITELGEFRSSLKQPPHIFRSLRGERFRRSPNLAHFVARRNNLLIFFGHCEASASGDHRAWRIS